MTLQGDGGYVDVRVKWWLDEMVQSNIGKWQAAARSDPHCDIGARAPPSINDKSIIISPAHMTITFDVMAR
jgi:hypothetical protein